MGEYDAVSASRRFTVLAKQIAELRKELDATRKQLGQAREETAQLREMVSGLSEAVQGEAAADKEKPKNAAPRWDNLTPDQATAQLAELREWVEGILKVHYPGYPVPDCWESHMEALWELGTLHAEWKRTYANPQGADLTLAELFHERHLPGVVARLEKAIGSGATGCSTHRFSHGASRPRPA